MNQIQSTTNHISFDVKLLWNRYIDDKLVIIDIDKNVVHNSLLLGHFISASKKAFKNLYPSNIKLKAKISKALTFLDIQLSGDHNNIINTKIYQKPMSKHISLHYHSNNPPNHKKAVFTTELFRSICINDNTENHNQFRLQLIKSNDSPWILSRDHSSIPIF